MYWPAKGGAQRIQRGESNLQPTHAAQPAPEVAGQLTDPSNPNTTHTRMNKGTRNPPSSTLYYPCIKGMWNARLIMHAHSFTHKWYLTDPDIPENTRRIHGRHPDCNPANHMYRIYVFRHFTRQHITKQRPEHSEFTSSQDGGPPLSTMYVQERT